MLQSSHMNLEYEYIWFRETRSEQVLSERFEYIKTVVSHAVGSLNSNKNGSQHDIVVRLPHRMDTAHTHSVFKSHIGLESRVIHT